MKCLSLWYLKLMKCCLHLIPLLCVINILFFVINTEFVTIDEPFNSEEKTVDGIKQQLTKNKAKDKDYGLFKCFASKKRHAQYAEDANKSLQEIENIICDDIKIDTDNNSRCGTIGATHYWRPLPNYPQCVFYYTDGNDFMSDNIVRFPIPIKREENKINILTFCPSQWKYLQQTIIMAPCWNDMETGGAKKASNMNAEVINRDWKFIEGFKNLRLDTYGNHMFALYLGRYSQWLLRVREQIAKNFKNLPFLKDFWNGKNHLKEAATAFDKCLISHFTKLCDFEKTLNMRMGKDKLWLNLHDLINKSDYKNEYDLKYISKQMMYCIKHNKAIEYKQYFYIDIQSYLILWMRDRLKNAHEYDIAANNSLNIGEIEELKDKNLNDCNLVNDDQ